MKLKQKLRNLAADNLELQKRSSKLKRSFDEVNKAINSINTKNTKKR